MTQDEITAGLEIAEKATSAPWKQDRADVLAGKAWANMVCRVWANMENEDNDAAFIASSRTGWPIALEALQRLYALHVREPYPGQDEHADSCPICLTDWPCATIRAIEGAAE